MDLRHRMRERAAVVAVLVALLTASASAELLEFNATLSIESIETLFPPTPGQNSGPFFNTVPPGHGYANVTPAGGIASLLGVTGLKGTVRVGDLGTDAFFNFWEVEIDGIGAPSFTGAPLHGPMPLFIGDVRNLSLMATGFDQRSAGGLGMLQMVTPMSHETTGNFLLPSGYRGGAFAVLGLEFIPEPARFILLTSGALFLCALGQSRRRARRN